MLRALADTLCLCNRLCARYLQEKVPLFINGKFVQSKTDKWIDLRNPATNEVICKVPQATKEEMQQAADAAAEAYKTWRNVGVQHRQRVMLKFQHLIREHTEELAHSITNEQGKTLADARGDIFRGLGASIGSRSLPLVLVLDARTHCLAHASLLDDDDDDSQRSWSTRAALRRS